MTNLVDVLIPDSLKLVFFCSVPTTYFTNNNKDVTYITNLDLLNVRTSPNYDNQSKCNHLIDKLLL